MEQEGKLIIFSAPSGAGKTTIVQHLLTKFPELEFLGGWSYPYTVSMMVASALVPMWYFRKRGWLK